MGVGGCAAPRQINKGPAAWACRGTTLGKGRGGSGAGSLQGVGSEDTESGARGLARLLYRGLSGDGPGIAVKYIKSAENCSDQLTKNNPPDTLLIHRNKMLASRAGIG